MPTPSPVPSFEHGPKDPESPAENCLADRGWAGGHRGLEKLTRIPTVQAGLDLRQSAHPTQPALLPPPGEAASQEDSPPGRRAREEPQPFSWTRVCTRNTSWGFSSASLTVPPQRWAQEDWNMLVLSGRDQTPPHHHHQVTKGVAPAVWAS